MGALQPKKDFQAPLAWANTMIYPGFNRWPLPLPRTKRVKKLTDVFQKKQLFTQYVSVLYAEKSALRYYVRFLQIQSQLKK